MCCKGNYIFYFLSSVIMFLVCVLFVVAGKYLLITFAGE